MVLDFLEELHDKAPDYIKLPDLLKLTGEHLGQKAKLNDTQAAAWNARFNQVSGLPRFQSMKNDAQNSSGKSRITKEDLQKALEQLEKRNEEELRRLNGWSPGGQPTKSAEIQTDSLTQSRVVSEAQRPTFTPGTLFFSEDFSSTAEGHLPQDWFGESVLVRQNGRAKMLTNFDRRKLHKIHVGNVEFPENFRLEWVLRTNPRDFEWAPVTYDMTVGSMTARLYMKSNDNPYANNSRATVFLNKSENAVPYAGLGNSVVTFALEKSGATFKLFLDNRVVVISRDEKYQPANGFTFQAKTVHDDWSFGLLRVAGKAL